MVEQMRSPDGNVYQLLWKTNPIMMIYNKTIFEEAGYLSPPATYSEFIQAADLISMDRNSDGYNDRWIGITDIRARWRDRLFDFYPFYIAASGGKTFLDKGKLAVNESAAKEVFAFFQNFFKNDYFPYIVPDGSHDLFLHSDVATRITGPWEITHADKLKPEGFRYDFSSLPKPDNLVGPSYTYADPKSIVIFSETKYPQETWNFAQFLIRKQSDFYLLDLSSQLPYRKEILSDSVFQEYFTQNPLMVRFAKQLKYTRATDSSPVLKELFDAISQEFEACVIYYSKTPEQAVEDMINRMKLVLK
jgi:multiple sugar transport system substrate-binding protein